MTPHTLAALILATAASALAAPPAILSVRQALPEGASPADRALPVGRYEKVELRVDVQATFENPYDPDDVDVWAEFTAPSGRVWQIWAFYNPSSWSALWMVRFAPTETGTWLYLLHARDREGSAEGKPGQLSVVERLHSRQPDQQPRCPRQSQRVRGNSGQLQARGDAADSLGQHGYAG